MILIQNEILHVEYEEALNLLYYERRSTGSSSEYREAFEEVIQLAEKNKIRFCLINGDSAYNFLPEDNAWLLKKLDDYFDRHQDLERVAVIPSKDLYNLMTTESVLEHVLGKVNFELQYFNDVASARDWLEEAFREVCFFDEGLDLEYDSYHHWIYSNWRGNQDFNAVKRGCDLIYDLLVAKNCTKLFIDNRLALGDWSEAIPWILEEFVPRLEKKGIKAIGWVLSPSMIHRLTSLELIKAMNTSLQVELFNEFSAAKQWLKQYQPPNHDQIAFPKTKSENQK